MKSSRSFSDPSHLLYTFLYTSAILTCSSIIASVFTFDPDVRHFSAFKPGIRMGYINMEVFSNHILNVKPIRSTIVMNYTACSVECIRQAAGRKCLSINMEQLANNKHICSLIATDKYRAYQTFLPKANTNHYGIKSACSQHPCLDGFICIPHYGNRSFECKCKYGYEGQSCSTEITSVALPKEGSDSQSSTAYQGHSSRAIDGNYNQMIAGGPCSHTARGIGEWWQFTFDVDVLVKSVEIYIRTDECCSHKMNNAIIEVFDADQFNFKLCGSLGVSNHMIKLISCGAWLRGRGVRVTQTANFPVELCEIDFYGKFEK